MAKKVVGQIKLQIPAGQANPAPPVGPALGQQGVNIMAFCKEFNAATKEQAGMIIPVVITVYQDKSFTFITKSPPASVLLKKAAGIASGSKKPNKEKVGKETKKQVMEIVRLKLKDLNATNEEAAFRVVAGTARSMAIRKTRNKNEPKSTFHRSGNRRRRKKETIPSKRYKKALESVDKKKSYPLKSAVEVLSRLPKAKCNETVELSFRLGVD